MFDMKKTIIHSLVFILLFVIIAGSSRIALAHGNPVIAVNPAIVAAGGKITVTGTEMEANEVFSITLEGMTGSTRLGDATAVKAENEEDGGFATTFTIPSDITSGSYTVKASPEDGDAATTDLTITSPSDQASSAPATMQEPSSAPHPLNRSKPPSEEIEIGIVALASVVLGMWLIRPRG